MTCIEFFDNNAIDNIFTCLTVNPDRVILVGDNGKLLAKHAERYKLFTDAKKMNVEFSYCAVTRNNIFEIVNFLVETLERYKDDEFIFDLTGGEDLYLTAAGMILERFPDKKIQMHRVNYLTGQPYDVDGDSSVISKEDMPKLTVRECIKIYGGDVLKTGGTLFSTDSDPVSEINFLWELCRENSTEWNRQTGVLAAGNTDASDPLKMTYEYGFIENRCRKDGIAYDNLKKLLNTLLSAKLIKTGYDDRGGFYIIFKSDITKNCLTVSGRTLELQIYNAVRNYVSKNELFYNDVENDIIIKWDGDIDPETPDPVNEIDIMMMRGAVPVFVSCKNGRCTSDELYKLNTVAARFGGKYAKKILALANPADKDADFRQRAKEMGIKLFDDLARYNEKGIAKEIRKFWN